MHVLFIFIDGFGLGPADSAVNPLVRFPGTFFPLLLGGPLSQDTKSLAADVLCFTPLDATLGVDGLPQSATGQTALFTGVNAPKKVGHHVQAFPGPQLAAIISESGLMGCLKKKGLTVTSANMYTPNYLELVAARKRRHSVTTLLTLAAGERLRSLPDMLSSQAVYQDITNEMLAELGVTASPVTPTEAGRRLVGIAASHHFTLFEYFQTDRYGHKQNWQKAEVVLAILDEFLMSVYQSRPADMLVVISSDHGNFEDFSVKTHTLNLVPGLFFGRGAAHFGSGLHDLADVAPAIEAYFEREVRYGSE